jgi:hypothetical protein
VVRRLVKVKLGNLHCHHILELNLESPFIPPISTGSRCITQSWELKGNEGKKFRKANEQRQLTSFLTMIFSL